MDLNNNNIIWITSREEKGTKVTNLDPVVEHQQFGGKGKGECSRIAD